MRLRSSARRIRFALSLALLPLAAAACRADGPAGPEPRLAGRYDLAALGAEPLPVLYHADPATRRYLLGGSLDFAGETVLLRRSVRIVELAPDGSVSRDRVVADEVTLPYEVTSGGARVLVGYRCRPDPAALCAYGEEGAVREGRLEMNAPGFGAPLVYTRE